MSSSLGTDFSDMQARNNQTLTDIQELQSIEKGLFNNLESGIANNALTVEQKNTLIGKINEISVMRINLYKNLNGMYGFFEKNMASSRDTVAEQTAAIDIVENELNRAKRRLQAVQEDNNNKIRLVEINSYYGDQYADYANIMKLIVYFCIPILICTILVNSGILPSGIFKIILIVIVVIAVIFIGKQIITMFSRDKMNYSEFDWNTDKSKLPAYSSEPTDGTDPWASTALTCQGQSCCPENYTYDVTKNMCISSELLAESTSVSDSAAAALAAYMQNSKKAQSSGYQMGGFGSL
jgi:hypothetical protein